MKVYVIIRDGNRLDGYEFFTSLTQAEREADLMTQKLHEAGQPSRWGDSVGKLHNKYEVRLLTKKE